MVTVEKLQMKHFRVYVKCSVCEVEPFKFLPLNYKSRDRRLHSVVKIGGRDKQLIYLYNPYIQYITYLYDIFEYTIV